eukprot:15439_1
MNKTILNKSARITLFTRLCVEAGKSNKDGISRIFSMYGQHGKSPQWLKHHIDLYVTDLIKYHPHKSEEDKLRACLVVLLSGPKVLDTLYQSGSLVSTKTARNKVAELQSEKIICGSNGFTLPGLRARMDEITKKGPWNDSEPIGTAAFSGDELTVSTVLEVDLCTNHVPSICSEHFNPQRHINVIVEPEDADTVIEALESGAVHLGQLVFELSVTIQRSENDYIFIMGAVTHCGKRAHEYHSKWLQSLSIVGGEIVAKTNGRLVCLSFTSDGWTQMRTIKKQLCYKSGHSIDCKIPFIPTKTVAKDLVTTSDMRHNGKSDYAKMFKKGINILGQIIYLKDVRQYGIVLEVWKIPQARVSKKSFMSITSCAYQSDPMNVPNVQHIFSACYFIGVYKAEIKTKLDPLKAMNAETISKHDKKLNAIKIFGHIKYSYFSSLVGMI